MIASIHLAATYAGQGYLEPNHILTDVVQSVLRYDPDQDRFVPSWVPYRDPENPHCWLNAKYSNFPEGIPHGTKVSFWASFFPRMGGQRLTDVREVRIIEGPDHEA